MNAQPQPDPLDDTVTPLAAALEERGISGQRLARSAGVHENSVYAWRAGRASPNPDSAMRVADALGLPLASLFPHLADRPSPSAQPVFTLTADQEAPRLLPRPPLPTADELRDQWAGEIGRHLAAAMADRDLSARQVADAAGVSTRTVQRWLSGHTALPDPQVTARLASALNLPADTLGPARPLTPLAHAAQQHGFDAGQLAAAVGVSPQAARNWLAGRNNPGPDMAMRVAAALDRQVGELFDVAPVPEPEDADQLERQPIDVRKLPTVDQVLTAPATGRDDWGSDAACAQPDQEPEAWWPTNNDPAYEARATCGGCPVQGDCRDTYLDGPDTPEARTAIWAGLPGSRLRSLARTHTATAGREPQPGRDRAPDATSAPSPIAERRPSAQPASPAPTTREARGAASADAALDGHGRAKVLRPIASSAPESRAPRAEPSRARAVNAESARTTRDGAADAGEQARQPTAPEAAPRTAAQRADSVAAGMVL